MTRNLQDPDFRQPINEAGGLPPPRFSLSTLFWLVGFVAIFVSLIMWMGSHAGALFLAVFFMVLLHVAGNAIGTKLKAHSHLSSEPILVSEQKAAVRREIPATSLSHKVSLGRPLVVASLFGLTCGAGAGVGLLRSFYPQEQTIAVVFVCATVGGIFGGLFFFWLWSLCQVTFVAWREAQRISGKHQ